MTEKAEASRLDAVWADFSEQRVAGAARDLSGVAADAEAVEIQTKNFGDWPGLAKRKELRRASFGAVTPEALRHIADLQQLEALWLWDVRVESLDPLAGLGDLRDVVVRNAPRLHSLAGIAGLPGLRSLWLWDLPRLSTLDGLAGLGELRELRLESAPSRDARGPQRFPSFAPLAGLAKLEWLHLSGIAADDDSLRPLSGLKRLRRINLANAFPLAEFAGLAAALPEAGGNFAKPVWSDGSGSCRKCGAGKVMLLGRGARAACPSCDAARIEAHIAEFERLRAAA